MHPLKLLFFVGTGAIGATAENDSGCSSILTVYVTAPASPTTKSIYAVSKDATSTNVGIEAVATQAELITSHTVTKTVTHPVISTQFVHIIHASSLLEGQGAYSFTEDNGTTTWLGATPPATASLLFSTHIVTLHPVPLSSSPLQKGTSTVTRYLTVSSTETVTKILTETKTLSISTASAPSYTGMGSGGWNSTMATLKKTKPLVTGPGKPVLYQSGVEVKLVHHDETAYPLNPSGTLTRRIKARGIGDVVVATIGGAVVSWTNNYAGSSPSTKTEATMAPVTMTAPVIGGPSSPSTILATPGGPMTTVGIYPWDVSQLASHSAIESTSTTQSKILWVSVSTNLTNVMTPSVSAPPLSTAPYLNTSTALSSAAAAPSSCDSVPPGFIIDFDDLPAFSTGPEDTDIPPIFNPYHKLYFQKYFGYVPPPTDPFPPISGRQLAVYRESGLNIAGPADADFELTGEIGAGPRASNNAYWIDAYSAYLGCTNPGPESCTITINGYVDGATVSHMTQTVNQPPCPGLKNCSLALVAFEDGFRGLTGFQIIATVASKPVDWYMDDFSLGWSNNTCTAQLERSSSR